jgi:hypothetical protein
MYWPKSREETVVKGEGRVSGGERGVSRGIWVGREGVLVWVLWRVWLGGVK